MKSLFARFKFIVSFVGILALIGLAFSCGDDESEPPRPEVTTITPASALPNTLVAITGKFFNPVFSENKVTFNGKEALISNASSTQLNVVVPAGAETGPVVVTVGGRAASNQPVFSVLSFPSVITKVAPTSGGYNTEVTITGSNFLPTPEANVVTFNGVAGTVTAVTATSLTVKVPTRAGSGAVIVNGVAAGIKFNYIPDVFVAGYSYIAGLTRAMYWKNGVANILSGPATSTKDIFVVQDDIYIAGSRHSGPFPVARWWKNGTEMQVSDDAHYSSAEEIRVVGNDVYIAGFEWNSANKAIAKYWKNGVAVNISDGAVNSYAYGLEVRGQDVYIGGTSVHPNGNGVAAYWKNGATSFLTTGASFGGDMFVSGNDVYTVGSIRNTGIGVDFVAYWKIGAAVLLGPGLGWGMGTGIVVVGNDVYVSGFEENAKKIEVAKYWKNGLPIVLTDGASNARAEAIDVVGEDVYVVGYELNAAGITVVKYWKNSVPVPITDGSYHASPLQ